jgi:AraC-like DNA-binding protein
MAQRGAGRIIEGMDEGKSSAAARPFSGEAGSRAAEQTSIAAICSTMLIQSAVARGLDAAPLARAAGLPRDRPVTLDDRTSFEQYLGLWELVMRTLDDPAFPIFAGSRVRPSDYETMGFLCMVQPTVEGALEQAVRYHRFWTDASGWEIERAQNTVTLRFVVQQPLRLGPRCGSESLLAEMVHAGRLLTGGDLSPTQILFRHEKPRKIDAHEAMFRSPVRFGAEVTALVFDAEVLALPLLKGDRELAAFFERKAQEFMGRIDEVPQGSSGKLRAVLLDEFRRGVPTLEGAATRLGLSARTLRRRLQEEGTTFQDVLDETRCRIAKRHLQERRLALGEVAFLLGFSEPSAFHRAFKRWTGTTPLAFRRDAAG